MRFLLWYETNPCVLAFSLSASLDGHILFFLLQLACIGPFSCLKYIFATRDLHDSLIHIVLPPQLPNTSLTTLISSISFQYIWFRLNFILSRSSLLPLQYLCHS
ncbi:hypothetical protein B0O99DRAFT_99592 [Bisporella sp. PMI_857]|nr:hypothetical protein B0O99DRAFT_99592 [Bisporella sp. PMI_857]